MLFFIQNSKYISTYEINTEMCLKTVNMLFINSLVLGLIYTID